MIHTETCDYEGCEREAATSYKGGKEVWCKGHYNQLWRTGRQWPMKPYKHSHTIDGYRLCTQCERYKPIEDFYVKANGYVMAKCHECYIPARVAANRARRERQKAAANG